MSMCATFGVSWSPLLPAVMESEKSKDTAAITDKVIHLHVHCTCTGHIIWNKSLVRLSYAVMTLIQT